MSGAPMIQIWWLQVPEILYLSIFVIAWNPVKVVQGDLLFVCSQGLFVGQRMQDYKYLCTAVTICATLFDPKFDLSFWPPDFEK